MGKNLQIKKFDMTKVSDRSVIAFNLFGSVPSMSLTKLATRRVTFEILGYGVLLSICPMRITRCKSRRRGEKQCCAEFSKCHDVFPVAACMGPTDDNGGRRPNPLTV